MAENAAAKVIGALIKRVHDRHAEAGLAIQAASTFSKHGKIDQALRVLMDFEGPTHDTLDMFRTALTLKRELLSPDD